MRLILGLFGMAAAAMAQQPAPGPAPVQPARPAQQMQQQMQRQMQQMQPQMQQQMQARMQRMEARLQRMEQQRPGAARQAAARSALQRLLNAPSGRWWTDPNMVQRLSLTADQQKKLDETSQQYRLQMIDRNAAVQREEAILEPLAAAEQPDEAKIIAQMDKLSQARGELEKTRVRMTLAMRRVLTQDQWTKLNAPPNPMPMAAPAPNPPAAPNQPAR